MLNTLPAHASMQSSIYNLLESWEGTLINVLSQAGVGLTASVRTAALPTKKAAPKCDRHERCHRNNHKQSCPVVHTVIMAAVMVGNNGSGNIAGKPTLAITNASLTNATVKEIKAPKDYRKAGVSVFEITYTGVDPCVELYGLTVAGSMTDDYCLPI